jgi:hypothetical protein
MHLILPGFGMGFTTAVPADWPARHMCKIRDCPMRDWKGRRRVPAQGPVAALLGESSAM